MDDGTLDKLWERVNIARVTIPAPLALSWTDTVATRIACHIKVAGTLSDALVEIHRAGLWEHLQTFGGGFNFRAIKGSSALSLHSIGLAVDFDPVGNPYRQPTALSRFASCAEGMKVVDAFERHGWYWGGRFMGNPDAMHFQFGTGC